jgi:protein tyrosine phosphatase type 4A
MENPEAATPAAAPAAAPPSVATAATAAAGGGVKSQSVQLANKPSKVEYRGLKFMIIDRPTEYNLPSYLKELKESGVTALVRVCEPTYAPDSVNAAGITMYDYPFDDGTAPPLEVIKGWRKVVKEHGSSGGNRVAIHCVAGLGRAPVMVAIALIDKGCDFTEAVKIIRAQRKGAINKRQLDFLRSYKPASGKSSPCCVS